MVMGRQSNFSSDGNVLPGHEEIPISQIKEGNNFTTSNTPGEIFRATADTKYDQELGALVLEAEDIDFKHHTFRFAKSQLGYAPKFFLLNM